MLWSVFVVPVHVAMSCNDLHCGRKIATSVFSNHKKHLKYHKHNFMQCVCIVKTKLIVHNYVLQLDTK